MLGKERDYRQSLYDHSMTLVNLGCLLLKYQILNPNSEKQTQAFLLALAVHDAGKEREEFQNYIRHGGENVSDTDLERSEQVAQVLCERMQWGLSWEDVRAAVRLHMKARDSDGANLLELLSGGHSSDRWRQMAQWVQDIDHVASAASPAFAEKAWRNSRVLSKVAPVTFHSLRLRGVSSVLVHDAIKSAFQGEGWEPLLYYPTGTLYVAIKKDAYVPTRLKIREHLVTNLQDQVKKTSNQKIDLMHGSIIATYLVKTDLFATDDVFPILNRARRGLNPRSGGNIPDEVVLAYYNIQQIFKETGDPKLAKKAGQKDPIKLRKAIPEGLHEQLVFSINDLPKETKDLLADNLGKSYPEIAILKMFKNIFNPDNEIVEKDMLPLIEKYYDGVFGKGSFEALQTTSTLMPAIDMALTIDMFWQCEPFMFGFDGASSIKYREPSLRQDALIKKLSEIAKNVFIEAGVERSTESLVQSMADQFIKDMDHPAYEESLINMAEQQLKAYTVAKANVKSPKPVPHICPLCNNDFEVGKAAISDYVNKATAFSNRISAYTGNGFYLCRSCYYERLLQQLLLGGKPGEFICVIPPQQLSEMSSSTIKQKVIEFQMGIERFTRGQDSGIKSGSLTFENIIAKKLNQNEESSFAAERFADLFSYNKAEDRLKNERKSLEEALLEEFNSFELICEVFGFSYSSMDEFIDALIQGEHGDNPDLEEILNKVIRTVTPVQAVYRTPNFILFPTFNSRTQGSAIANDKDSDTKLAYKQLLIACLFSEYLNMSVALVNEVESVQLLIEGMNGKVYIPNHPRLFKEIVELRKRLGSEANAVMNNWLDDDEALKWRKGIVAAILLASSIEMSERDDIPRILSYKLPGELVRRIQMKHKDKPLHQGEWKQIEIIKEVLA